MERLIGATTVGTGEDWFLNFRLGDQQCIGPQLLGRSFQKARNFTASSQQNAEFSIWVFKKIPWVIPRTLTAGGDDPLPHPTPSPAFWPGAGGKRTGVETQTLVPLNFSAVVAPLERLAPVRADRPSLAALLRRMHCSYYSSWVGSLL